MTILLLEATAVIENCWKGPKAPTLSIWHDLIWTHDTIAKITDNLTQQTAEEIDFFKFTSQQYLVYLARQEEIKSEIVVLFFLFLYKTFHLQHLKCIFNIYFTLYIFILFI